LKKSEWSDNQLEELLQHLPKVKDKQDPDELYRKISSRIQKEQIRKSNKKTWLLPSVAAVAAVFLILLIGPTFMNLSGGSNESANEESAASTESMDSAAKQENNISLAQEGKSFDIASSEENATFEMAGPVIVDNILITKTDGDTLITMGIPDTEGQSIIPVSMLSAESGKSQLELLEQALSTMSEEEYGLSPNPFEGLTFEEGDDDTVIITFPSDFVSNGAANDNTYYFGIPETFRWMGYTEAILRKEEGGQVEFGNYGPQDSISFSTAMKKGYYVYTSETGQTYLVPSRDPSNTFKDALDRMMIEEYNLEASIPTNVTIEDVNEIDEDSVTVTFSNDNSINQDEISHQLMIKAILLTAKEFGYVDVTFVNAPEQIGDIQLMQNGAPNPVDVPAAPNYINFPTSK
jgi:hypothetical protein